MPLREVSNTRDDDGSRSAGPLSTTRYLPCSIYLDVLRFAAALYVALYHYSTARFTHYEFPLSPRAAIGSALDQIDVSAIAAFASAGWIGVPLFFVVSGFVVAISVAGRSAAEFMRLRLVRILPVIVITSLITLVTCRIYSDLDISVLFGLFLKQVCLFPKGPWLTGVFWTMIVEVAFYLATMAAIHLRSRLPLEEFLTGWGVMTIGFVLVSGLLPILQPDAQADILAFVTSYRLKPMLVTTGPYFVFGAFVFLLIEKGFSPVRAAFAGVSGTACLVDIGLQTVADPIYREIGAVSTLPAAMWALCMLGFVGSLCLRIDARLLHPLKRLSRHAGHASFPFYLLHDNLGAFLLGRLVTIGLGTYQALTLALAACCAVSVFIVVRLERPIRRILLRSDATAAFGGRLR